MAPVACPFVGAALIVLDWLAATWPFMLLCAWFRFAALPHTGASRSGVVLVEVLLLLDAVPSQVSSLEILAELAVLALVDDATLAFAEVAGVALETCPFMLVWPLVDGAAMGLAVVLQEAAGTHGALLEARSLLSGARDAELLLELITLSDVLLLELELVDDAESSFSDKLVESAEASWSDWLVLELREILLELERLLSDGLLIELLESRLALASSLSVARLVELFTEDWLVVLTCPLVDALVQLWALEGVDAAGLRDAAKALIGAIPANASASAATIAAPLKVKVLPNTPKVSFRSLR